MASTAAPNPTSTLQRTAGFDAAAPSSSAARESDTVAHRGSIVATTPYGMMDMGIGGAPVEMESKRDRHLRLMLERLARIDQLFAGVKEK